MSKHAHSTDDRCQFYHPQKKIEERAKEKSIIFPKFLKCVC